MSTSRAKKKARRRARATGEDEPPAPATQRPARPAAPQGAPARPARFEVRDGVPRPQALWAPFPLTELGMLAGLAIFAWGFASDGSRALWLMGVAALLLAVVVGELCLREHFAGFRSHTLLLAALPVAVVHGALFLAIGGAWRGPPALACDLAFGGALAWLLHRRFRAAHERARDA